MGILQSCDKSGGEITLKNGWMLRLGTNEDTGNPNTVVGIYEPNGSRYDLSHVLMNMESPADVVEEFEQSVSHLSSLDQLDRLEKHDSQVIREMVRVLPEFDSQGQVV